MDRITIDTNHLISERIQDWLIQSWFANEPESLYREALIYVLLSLWPKFEEAVDGHGRPSYFPLPALCCQALGGETATAVEVNAAWVLLYMASYLLDKVEDQELNHPLISRLGPGVVANLSTGLILHAGRILARLGPDLGVPIASLDAIRQTFYQMALEVCNGQHLDLALREPTLNETWKIIDRKSGKFFSMGCFLGARLVTEDAAQIEAFTQFGRKLGILVQLANDLEGILKEDARENDLATGKRTLPVIYALQVLPENERGRLLDLLNRCQQDPDSVSEARGMVISSGAIVYLSLEAEKHRQLAKGILGKTGVDAEASGPLLRLLDRAFENKITLMKFEEARE